ncbi:MAG: hypothetical protein F6K14_08500 [Symploca sp. SIO2C1]|nr:hypothetical protein [Symploca sp. SIO2C1]
MDYEDGLRYGAVFGSMIGAGTMILIPIMTDFVKGVGSRLTSQKRKGEHEIGAAVVAVLRQVSTQLEDITDVAKTLIEHSRSRSQKYAKNQVAESRKPHNKHAQHINGAVQG